MAPTKPSAAESADRGVERARASGGGSRLATARSYFLLDPAERLTEQERALMSAMLLGLIGTIADEIRVRLPEALAEACDCSADELERDLRRSGLLDRKTLIALLLRRADEVGIADAATGGGSPVQGWTSDSVPGVAAAAMAVVLARAAARDRFGRPGLELSDCDAENAVHLAYAVAAALAARGSGADEALVAAAVDLLGRHDEGQRLHALEARLVIALEDAGRLSGDLLAQLAASGEAGLLAEVLGRLGGISGDAAWNLLTSGEAETIALLLRMAGQPRVVAAQVLSSLTGASARLNPLAEMAAFDLMSEEEATGQRASLRHPPSFVAAIEALRLS